ncbi:MAG: CAP domain-containing protein [Paracoccaceae bacterium]
MTQKLPVGAIDQVLFSIAVLGQVNFYRCQEGVQLIASDNGLIDVATIHAMWMAAESRLSHNSTVVGQSDVTARVISAIVTPSTGSENIGYVHRYRIDEGEIFFIGATSCSFETRYGRQIEKHSYASLALRIVDLWMASPGHRVNVLDNRMRLTGSAVALDPSATHCGVYYMSQEFAG